MSGVATLKLRGSKRCFDEMAVDLPLPPQACSPNRFVMRPPPLKRGRVQSPSASASGAGAPPSLGTDALPPPGLIAPPHPLAAPPHNHPHLHAAASGAAVGNMSASSASSASSCAKRAPFAARRAPHRTDTSHAPPSADAGTASRAHVARPDSLTTATGAQQQPSTASAAAAAASNATAANHSAPPRALSPPLPAASSQPLTADDLSALARHVPKRLRRAIERLSSGAASPADRLFSVADLRDILASVLSEREAKLNEQFAVLLHERLAEQFRDFTKFNEDYVSRQLRGRDFAYLS